MTRSRCLFFLVLVMLLGLSACAIKDVDLLDAHSRVTDDLIQQAELYISKDDPILVAPFMSVDRLDRSSSFGRIAAEQFAGRLVNRGFKVVDAKVRTDDVSRQKGELEHLLTNELANLSKETGAKTALVGSYAAADETVFVSARLVRIRDNVALAWTDYAIPMGPDAEALVKSRSMRRGSWR